jgi:2-aminoadipate transaminase
VDEDEIREGVRRIGKVIAEQVELFGTLTGHEVQGSRGMPGREAEDMPDFEPRPDDDEGDVVPFRRANP